MMTNKFLAHESGNTIEDRPENSAFACEQCNKMYIFADALTISMTCCGEPLKELNYEAAIP